MVTISDVAKAAGVSKAAVSYALSGSKKVSEKTREKILNVATELNYIPNKNALILRSGKTHKVGLFITYFSGSYFMYLTESISKACELVGYNLDVHIVKCHNAQDMISEILYSNIDIAIVLYRFNEEDEKYLADTIFQKGKSIVFLASANCYDHASGVVINNIGSFAQMADYLYETGHRKIVYLGGFENTDERERYEGLKKGLNQHNTDIYDIWDYADTDPNEWVGFHITKANFQKIVELPDAICCANDPLAIGCIKALKTFGYNVPRNISVTGFDNLIPAKLCKYKLTTMNNPVSELGKLAVEEAIRLLDPDEKGKIIMIDSQLSKGETVAIRAIDK